MRNNPDPGGRWSAEDTRRAGFSGIRPRYRQTCQSHDICLSERSIMESVWENRPKFHSFLGNAFGASLPHNETKYSLGDASPLYHRGMVERSFTLRVIEPSDTPEVINFLNRFFFRDEPLNIETGMDLDYINGKTCPELEGYCTDSIPEGNSVMAVGNTGQLVGVCLNGRVSRDSNDEKECPNDKFKKVLVLLGEAAKQTDIFSKYPQLQQLLDVKIISVDSSWRGMGICKALLEKTREVAKDQGFQMVKIDCTSHISALAVARLGFECIHVLKYAEHFQDGDPRPVFNPPPPHWAVQVYIFKLDDV